MVMPLVPGWVGGGGGMRCPVKKKLLYLFDKHGNAWLSVYGSTIIGYFSPAGYQSATSNLLRFLNVPSREKKVKDSVLLLESTNASLFIFTQHKVNLIPHLL